jgi:hypothetical protein
MPKVARVLGTTQWDTQPISVFCKIYVGLYSDSHIG